MSHAPAPMEDLPCDFTQFFAQRRQLSTEMASSLIGEWLVNYEPGSIARSHIVESAATAQRPVATASRARAGRLGKVAA